MIKISVYYAHGEGKTFDIDYYCKQHMSMVRGLLGDACKGIGVDHGLAGVTPGAPPTFVAIGHVLFDSVSDFQAAFGRHEAAIMGDVPNYTNIRPVMQISEVKL
jgi:uncharacterized protein (TIGR02118 family)